jgi:hypothetical protein
MCIAACWTTEEASCLSAMNCRTVSSLRRAAAPRSFSVLMTAASSPNDVGSDQTGFINKLTQYHWQLDQKRRAFKKANRTLYKCSKFGLIALAIYLFLLM